MKFAVRTVLANSRNPTSAWYLKKSFQILKRGAENVQPLSQSIVSFQTNRSIIIGVIKTYNNMRQAGPNRPNRIKILGEEGQLEKLEKCKTKMGLQ